MASPLDPAGGGMDNLQDTQEILTFLQYIEELADRFGGVNRLTVSVHNKHTGKQELDEADQHCFDLTMLGHEAERARRALMFVCLMKNFRDRDYPGV